MEAATATSSADVLSYQAEAVEIFLGDAPTDPLVSLRAELRSELLANARALAAIRAERDAASAELARQAAWAEGAKGALHAAFATWSALPNAQNFETYKAAAREAAAAATVTARESMLSTYSPNILAHPDNRERALAALTPTLPARLLAILGSVHAILSAKLEALRPLEELRAERLAKLTGAKAADIPRPLTNALSGILGLLGAVPADAKALAVDHRISTLETLFGTLGK
ncbi:MAG: hypothetical protein JSR82_22535 [Verrucomicrobia bacterium]|nr:hypothetical protein [Verrucomicrobiota bacterium]